MSSNFRINTILNLFACVGLLVSMPVVSMPADEIRHYQDLQNADTTSTKLQVEDISGFLWNQDTSTGGHTENQ